MRLLIVLLALACCAAVSTAQSQTPQQKPSPEEMQRMMESTFGVMVPMMGKMSEAMIQAQLKLAVLPETADAIATFKKNLFDALQKKGFTTEQALQIVLATNIPAASPGMVK